VEFVFSGSKETVSFAELLINYQLKHNQELDEIREEIERKIPPNPDITRRRRSNSYGRGRGQGGYAGRRPGPSAGDVSHYDRPRTGGAYRGGGGGRGGSDRGRGRFNRSRGTSYRDNNNSTKENASPQSDNSDINNQRRRSQVIFCIN